MRTRFNTVSVGMIVILAILAGCSQLMTKPAEVKADNGAIQLKNMDTNVSPGTNFFRYANGGWIDANPIPEEFGQYGAGHEVWLRNNDQVKAVVTDPRLAEYPEGSIERKIADFYSSGMDSVSIDAAGTSSLTADLDKINAMKSKAELSRMIGYLHKTSSNPLFVLYADQDEKNSENMIANLAQGGLGMTDRDQYLNDDERSNMLRDEYKKFMQTVFGLLGYSEDQINAHIDAIMEIETKLAANSMTRVERRDPEKGYNPMSLDELDKLSAALNFKTYFAEIGVADPGRINVRQTDYFQSLSDVINATSLDEWKMYLRWNLIRGKMGGLPQTYRDASFAFYGTALNGTQKQQPRWRQVLGVMNGSIGEAIGKAYVAKHFPPSSKARMVELVENLKVAYAARIQNLDWMTDETKAKALEKLAAVKVKVGYPDVWTDYSAMDIKAGSYADNLQAARNFHFQKDIAKIGKPVDRDEWFMSPQTVNAYYSPSLNEIVFPAGILQPPFFFPDGDEAVNYGAIGVVIGHEMTHGFDDQGRKFDVKGNLEDWWTEEDGKRFEEKAQLVIDQFNDFYITDSVHVNGELTLGENIADLGGLVIAYDALHKALETRPEPKEIAGFTQDQRFFLSYAQIWRGSAREAALLDQVQTDPHSPRNFRVLGPIVHTQPWYDSFSITAQDPLYVEQSERIAIW
ncbi:MAG: M13 family metallopeptidase [Candidatus Marinimicrobia bacterium]|nr:M13 family metallopeptidase [Candidatus Neomarinimicrobiota bacterium]